jgi:hypothetical protein
LGLWKFGDWVNCRFITRSSIVLTSVFHEYFFFPWNRKARDTNNVTDWAHWGWAMGMWFSHYRFTNAVKENRGFDWWWNAATPFDDHGFANFSYGTNNANIFSQCAKNKVIEVRSDYPWAEGGRLNTINIDDVDYWVEVDGGSPPLSGFTPTGPAGRRAAISAWPQVTFMSGMTEAPDETAQGEWLSLVTKAGFSFLMAHVKYLEQGQSRVERIEEGGLRDGAVLTMLRRRPVMPGGEGRIQEPGFRNQ